MDLHPKNYGIITSAINLRNQFTINAIYDNNKNLAMVSFHGILTHGIKYYQKKPCYSSTKQFHHAIIICGIYGVSTWDQRCQLHPQPVFGTVNGKARCQRRSWPWCWSPSCRPEVLRGRMGTFRGGRFFDFLPIDGDDTGIIYIYIIYIYIYLSIYLSIYLGLNRENIAENRSCKW